MSYLLDALKQSEQGEVSRTAQYAAEASQSYSQHKDLNFYRKLAFSLLAILAFIVILSIGFMAGRWFQGAKVQITPTVEKLTITETNRQVYTAEQAQIQSMPVQIQAAPVRVHQAMPTQYQLVPVQSAYNTSQAYQPLIQGSYQNAQGVTPVQTEHQIDYSQYKVVGKPMANQSIKDQKIKIKSEDNEITQLPTSLRTAFANAVAATESEVNESYEITAATKDSAMAQPIELLPDIIQSLIPNITYQAHIYATDSSRRWIKLNGVELYEGDSFGEIKVLEIAPEITLMSIEGYRFSLSAMDDWQP